MRVEDVRHESDTHALWDALQAARVEGDLELARAIERRMRAVADDERQRRIADVEPVSRTPGQRVIRAARSRAGAAVIVGVVGAGALLIVGALAHELTSSWWIGAAALAFFLAVIVALAMAPNRPYHPDAGREDRGFNYVRGEGGTGGS